MEWIRKHAYIIVLLVIVYTWFFIAHLPKQQSTTHVLGANTNISLFTEPQMGRDPILTALDTAHQEILMEVYLLSDKQIISSLEQAEARGVQVKVMLEKHPFGGGSLNNKTEQTLQANHISFEWTNPTFSLTHEKSIVIDDTETFILNQNLTTSSFTKNREYDVIDTNPQDVSEVRDIFIADWERKPVAFPADSHLLVSPENSREALTTLISDGTKTIDMEIEDINDQNITTLLSEKAKNLQIRLITPTLSQISSNAKSLRQLATAGVQVRTLSSPYIHAKLILVDDVKAYVGSVNLSTQSMDENRELGIILSENDSLTNLDTSFAGDWEKAEDFH